jgi:hypothetical protein
MESNNSCCWFAKSGDFALRNLPAKGQGLKSGNNLCCSRYSIPDCGALWQGRVRRTLLNVHYFQGRFSILIENPTCLVRRTLALIKKTLKVSRPLGSFTKTTYGGVTIVRLRLDSSGSCLCASTLAIGGVDRPV